MSCAFNANFTLTLMAGLLLAGCGGEPEQRSELTDSILGSGTTFVPGPGMAYDSLGQGFTGGTCVTGTRTRLAGIDGRIQWRTDLNEEQVLKNLNVNASVGFEIPKLFFLGATVAVSYASKSAADELSSTWHLFYQMADHQLILDNPQLSEAAKDLLNRIKEGKSTQKDLRTLCGDEYVDQITRGASFVATVKIKYSSEYQKTRVESSVNVSILKGLVGVEIGGGTEVQKWLENSSVEISALQIGGRPEELLRVLPYGPVECPMTSTGEETTSSLLKPCNEALVRLLGYVEANGPNDLTAQLADPETMVPLRYFTKTYQTSQVSELFAVSPLTAFQRQVLKERKKDLARELDQTEKTVRLARELRYGSPAPDAAPPYQDFLEELMDRGEQRCQEIRSLLYQCNEGPLLCLDGSHWLESREKIENMTLPAPKEAFATGPGTETFQSWCQLLLSAPETLEIVTRGTIRGILTALNIDIDSQISWEDCQRGEDQIKNLTTLDLSQFDSTGGLAVVTDLTPLKSLSFRHITTLSLRDQPVRNIQALSSWTRITHLDITGTSITNLDLLESLKDLECLAAERTRLLRLTQPLNHNKLRTLKLSGNRFSRIPQLRMPLLASIDLSQSLWQWPIDLSYLEDEDSLLGNLQEIILTETEYTGLDEFSSSVVTHPTVGSQDSQPCFKN